MTSVIHATEVSFADRDQPKAQITLARDLSLKLAAPTPDSTLLGVGKKLHLQFLHPQNFGIPPGVTDPTVGYDEGAYRALWTPGQLPPETLKTARALLTDERLGRPGEVKWESVQGRYAAWAINPLALAYLETGENHYLDRWCAYLDDWSLREQTDFWPIHCPPEHSKGAPATLHLLKLWGGIAKRRAEQGEPFPTSPFLRSLNKFLPEYPLMSMAHHRGNPRNWTIENAYFYTALGFYLDDFTIGRELQREGLRVLESYAVTHNMCDGTENQQMLGYNLMYLHSAMRIDALWLQALNNQNLPTHLRQLGERPAWREILAANRRDRVIRMLRMVTAEGRGPSTLRTDLRGFPLGTLSQLYPEKNLDPESHSILQWFRSKKKSPPPSVTSDHFPYGGYTFLRSGWEPHDSQGFLFSSPHPGASAGFNSERNNNALTLSAFGDDIFVSGDRGAYTKRPSPVRVDGIEQAFHLGLLAPLAAWDLPSSTRFHESEQLVLAEGNYAGPYGNRPQGNAGADALKKAMEAALWKTRHDRLVVLIKPATWLVFDEMTSNVPRKYTLDWRLPLEPAAGSKSYRTFRSGDIQTHDTPARILARRPGGTHVNLAFAADTPIRLETKAERSRGSNPGSPVSDFYRISAAWHGNKETSHIITLVQPWKNSVEPNISLEISNATQTGLATSANPTHPAFTARIARSGTTKLAWKKLETRAHVFVAWIPSGGGVRGLVLDGTSFHWEGKPVKAPMGDFEFSRDPDGTWDFHPIFRPVLPVRIHPPRALLDSREPVTLSCPTPETEIRYTVDGSPVTASSPRYTSPLQIGPSTWLRARAFRIVQPIGPEPEHDNRTSPESRAAFHRTGSFWPPVTTTTELSPGLKTSTSRGKWSDLWLGYSGGPKGPDLLHVHDGVLVVPESGIYTFHAPESWTRDNRIGGYDLALTIDSQTWFPETQRHAFGTWSVPLQKGPHRFKMRWVDFRRDAVSRFNRPGVLLNPVWDGLNPEITLSGPGLPTPQPIPKSWLFHE